MPREARILSGSSDWSEVVSELPQAFWSETPRARKDHICCECRGVIKAGEKYERVRGIWAGEADTFKSCFECAAIRNEFNQSARLSGCYDDEMSCFTQLYECVFESRDVTFIHRFLMNKKNRSADIPAWMWERLNELSKPEDQTFSGVPSEGTVVMESGTK